MGGRGSRRATGASLDVVCDSYDGSASAPLSQPILGRALSQQLSNQIFRVRVSALRALCVSNSSPSILEVRNGSRIRRCTQESGRSQDFRWFPTAFRTTIPGGTVSPARVR